MTTADNKHQMIISNCLRTAYQIAHNQLLFSDYEELIQLQKTNGLDLGTTFQGKTTCTEMVKIIAKDMKNTLCNEILFTSGKFSVITDESTSLSKKFCLMMYARTSKRTFRTAQRHSSWILSNCQDQSSQDASTICTAIIHELNSHGFSND